MYADPITGPQRKFIASLLEDREASSDLVRQAAMVATKKDASFVIGELKKAPRKNQPAQVAVEPGYYIKDDEVYQVVKSKKGYPYAKKMVAKANGKGGTWEYAPGVVNAFQGYSPLSAAQAGVLSKKIGWCCICGRTLTKKESVEAGIGPICSGKLGY